MNEYFLLMIIVLFSLVNIYRKIRNRKQIGLLTEKYFKHLKSKHKEVRMVTQEKVMSIFYFIWLGVAVACLWLPDPTNFHFVIGLCIFMIANCTVEILMIPQKYRLYYNDEAFLYKGSFYKYNSIKAIGYSKIFLQPAKVHFQNGQSIVLFKGGLDTIHQVIANKLQTTNKEIRKA